MQIRVEALNYKAYSKNTLQGFVDLVIPGCGLTIKSCTHHISGDKEWIGTPAKETTDRTTGAVKYINILYFTDEAHRAFQSAARAAVHALIGAGAPTRSGNGAHHDGDEALPF